MMITTEASLDPEGLGTEGRRRGVRPGKRRRKFPDPSILLCPVVPEPLHGMNPRTVLGKTWWDMRRKEAYTRFNRRCWACGTPHPEPAGLQAHEIYDYDYRACRAKLREIVALCLDCHNFIHSGRWTILLHQGRVTEAEYDRVIDRGVRIVKKHKLYRKWQATRKTAVKASERLFVTWNKWHLVMEGEKYYSLYGDLADWQERYSRERLDSISGKVTCPSTNIGSSGLGIWVIERNTRRYVGYRDYERVGKRKLEKGFGYSVVGIPPGHYYIVAVRGAPRRSLEGRAPVAVVAGKKTPDVHIELIDPGLPRKKRRRAVVKRKKL